MEIAIMQVIYYNLITSKTNNLFVFQEEVDAGAIVAQESVPVFPKDTVESLQERVKKAEHICYPKAMELLASGRIVLGEDGRVHYQW